MTEDMKPRLSDDAFRRLRDVIEGATGIHFPDRKRYFVEGRVRTMMTERGVASFDDFARLVSGGGSSEGALQSLIDAITIQETSFFRNPPMLDGFSGTVLPVLQGRRSLADSRPLRVLSAGCATGEEPYTIAIMALDNHPGLVVEVTGIDVSSRAIAAARAGIWDRHSMRNMPWLYRDRWFVANGNGFRLRPDALERLGGAVRFKVASIVDRRAMATYAGMDVVFCCNVLTYFSDQARRIAVRNLCDSLLPGGWLFLAQTEVPEKAPPGFSPVLFHKVVAYRKDGS